MHHTSAMVKLLSSIRQLELQLVPEDWARPVEPLHLAERPKRRMEPIALSRIETTSTLNLVTTWYLVCATF